MHVSVKSLIATAVLIGAIGQPQVTLASAPPSAERPADQRRESAANTAAERERRYAGLTVGDAFRRSLIDDDLDYVFSTMEELGQASGDLAGTRYFNGVRAFARGDFADATRELKDADTEDMMVAAVRTWALVGQGKPTEAVALWDGYGDNGSKPFYAIYRGLLAEQAGQAAAAMRQYNIAKSTGELMFAPDLAKRYAVLLVKAGKDRDAIRMFDEVFGEAKALDAQDTAFRQSLIAKRPQAQNAITPQNAVSALISNFATLRMIARRVGPPEGEGAAKPEQPKASADELFVDDTLALRTALLVDPRNEDVRFILAEMFSDIDEEEAARKTIEPVVSGPRVNEARLTLAAIYGNLEDPKRGLDMLDMIPEAARDGDWWNTRTDLLITRGDYAGALLAAQQCVVKARGRGDWAQDAAQVVLASALDYAGKHDEAKAIAKTLAGRLEKNNPIRGATARFLVGHNDTRALGQAVARDSITALAADGRTKIAAGSTLTRDPATRSEGIQLIRDGARDFARSPAVMNALGYTLITYDVDLEEGFRLLQKANAERPNSGAIMDSLGRAYYKLGNLEEAQRLIEGAALIRVESPDPEIFDNLGDVYWHLGRKEDARAQWRKAKALGGAYEERDGLDGKIRDGLTTPAPTRRDVPVIAEPDSV
jgi:tetratricopeptide (TPR) repeat protein